MSTFSIFSCADLVRTDKNTDAFCQWSVCKLADYIVEEIQLPLFATTTYRVFIF
jgi:hypothetical protein